MKFVYGSLIKYLAYSVEYFWNRNTEDNDGNQMDHYQER